MVKLLFHHSGYHEWYQMAKKFKGVRFDGKVMDKKDYHHLIDNFRTNGILDIFVLKQIFDHESAFGYNVAMEVLQAFFLVHGPVDSHPRPQFILPYFSPELKDDSYKKADDRLQLRVEILFKGLALPRYVHQLLTVAMFNTLNDAEEKYYKWSYANGATIEHGECSFHLVHDFKKHSLILQVTTPVSQVSQSWKKLAITCKKVVCCAKKCGKATRPEVNLFCCHCIYVRAEEPGYQLMKDWAYFNEDEIDYVRTKSYTQAKCFKENNKEGNLDVPLPLLEPCKELNENHVKQLMEYLERLNVFHQSVKVKQAQLQLYKLQERPPYYHGASHIYEAMHSPDVRQLFNQSDRVYQMSQPCRGRCLIINNYNFDPPRLGSDVDMQNIENVFTALSFDCTPHQDLTAQEMKDAIHRETQDEEHGCYGMFVLVIMTHGDQSTVCGIDGISVQRKEILDLLSNFKFTKMAGRPKLVVIQACSGVSEDRMNQPLLHDNRIDARAENGGELLQPEDEGLEPGDLPPPLIPLPGEIPSYQGIYLLNSSAPGFVSYRHPNFGSFFIRATVSTLYKHSCHKHVEDLSKQIQHKINKQREKYQQRGIRVGSQLVTYSNWLEPSKTLYLFSGFNPSM
ncbi:hypothetical protein EB796_012341 [Bugula neritina]|uniref:CASP8 n=1 Tax=Bugula neritina TaxID=10212 RepID=A0A7J7JVG3_BUGNE|nr:hypothetical protein EB796_012341 [Bugula neritina]